MAETLADISVWQGAIDWSAYAAWYRATYPGATPKASMKATEGVGYTDPQYWNNEAGTRANGIQRVHYHWGRPDLSGPEAEADWCWRVIGPNFQPNDLVELDYEQEGWAGNYEAWKNRWLARMATYTPRCGMYSGAWFLNPRGISWGPGFVHAAVYGPTPPVCDIWQFSSSGSFPGMNGLIDSNLLLTPAIFGDSGGTDVTSDELKQAMREVLNEGTVFGAQSWADTFRNMATGLQNDTNVLNDLKAGLKALKAEIDAAPADPKNAGLVVVVQHMSTAVDQMAAKVNKDLA